MKKGAEERETSLCRRQLGPAAGEEKIRGKLEQKGGGKKTEWGRGSHTKGRVYVRGGCVKMFLFAGSSERENPAKKWSPFHENKRRGAYREVSKYVSQGVHFGGGWRIVAFRCPQGEHAPNMTKRFRFEGSVAQDKS